MTAERIEEFWENATSDDVAKIANTRKSTVARFRDEENEGWVDYPLVGWKLSKHLPGHRWIDADGAMWNQCQVYQEPSWHAKKPDPGPGWALLGKFPDEPVAVGDEFFRDYEWHPSCLEIGDPQTNGIWYRRRIQPVEPEPKHYVLRVGDSVETPRGHLINVVSLNAEQRIYSLDAGDKLTLPNGQTITITANGFEVAK